VEELLASFVEEDPDDLGQTSDVERYRGQLEVLRQLRQEEEEEARKREDGDGSRREWPWRRRTWDFAKTSFAKPRERLPLTH
jgi:hypothetical protein